MQRCGDARWLGHQGDADAVAAGRGFQQMFEQ
jgi:hypothetical protein